MTVAPCHLIFQIFSSWIKSDELFLEITIFLGQKQVDTLKSGPPFFTGIKPPFCKAINVATASFICICIRRNVFLRYFSFMFIFKIRNYAKNQSLKRKKL